MGSILLLSAFFEAKRQEYYDRLLAVSNRSECETYSSTGVKFAEHFSAGRL